MKHSEIEPDYPSDDEANSNRTGLPAIDRFYSKYKTLDRSIEQGKDKRQAPIAYLKKLEEFNLLPSPLGMVTAKG